MTMPMTSGYLYKELFSSICHEVTLVLLSLVTKSVQLLVLVHRQTRTSHGTSGSVREWVDPGRARQDPR